MEKKRKRWGNCVLCAAFFIMCLGLPLAGAFCARAESDQAGEENRILARFPQVRKVSDLEAFPKAFETWYSDHLFLKASFVRWKSRLETGLFHELDSETVILGTKKPWLFYCANDGQPLETYKRTNRFTDEELQEIAENISSLHDELEDAGIKFVLMIAPDKEQIYGMDYMPPEISVASGPTRTEQFIDYMAEYAPEVCIVYPKEALIHAKHSFEGVDSIYYETDTHWNYAGAYVGTQELLKAVAGQVGKTWEEHPKTFERTSTCRGDLQNQANLGEDYDSQEYMPVSMGEFESIKKITDQNEEVIWDSSESHSPDCLPVSVYLTGDSFRWHIGFYLQEAAAKAVVTSRYYFDPEDLLMQEPEVFVYSIAERYLHELSILPGYNTMALQMPES